MNFINCDISFFNKYEFDDSKIFGDTIYLRQLRISDVGDVYCSWLNDPVVNKHLATKSSTLANCKEFVRKQIDDSCSFFLGIFDKDNDKHIGNVKLEPINFAMKYATFGILIGDVNYWGKGVGAEVTKLIVDFAFNEMGLNKVFLGVKKKNIAALSIYKKVGFTEVSSENDAIKMVMNKFQKNKLALGTVQFGLDYGINNDSGKVPEEEVFQILDLSYESGIDILDSASAYGDSESVLGSYPNISRFNIISKFSKGDVEESVINSLKNLNVDKLYGCMVHTFSLFKDNPKIFDEMISLKESEKITKIGFSLYHPDELQYLIYNEIKFDIVQVPYSIFDQRFGDWFKKLKEMEVEIHVRSVFLQGLMFKDADSLPDIFNDVKDKIRKLHSLSKENQIPVASLCINFVTLNEDVDRVVMGVDNISNLQDNIAVQDDLLRVKCVYDELLELREDNKNIILPSNWVI